MSGDGAWAWAYGLNTVNDAFEADLEPCLAGMQPDDRSAVKYILGG